MWWLLLQTIFDDMQQAKAAGFSFTADQMAKYNDTISAADTSRVMSIAGDSAEIHVNGVLTNRPNIFAMFFGGGNTTYPEIISALAEADANPEVKKTIMRFSSGGGQVDGMFDAIAAMQTHSKPIEAVVDGLAASAAYGLASQADTVTAHNRASMVGSVGVVVDTYLDERELSVTSSNAPNKRPDLSTEEGKAVLVEQLDAVESLFIEAIAEGRSVSDERVKADFGRGATLLADEALKRGMIDGIAKTALQSVKSTNSTTASSGDQLEATEMDLKKLKTDHPGVYAQAVEDGKQQGIAAERDRVSAHLTLGQQSGDMKTATQAIEDGAELTAGIQAKYLAAGMNRNDQGARGEDNPGDLGSGGDTADQGQNADAQASANILAQAFTACGVEQQGG